MYPWPTDQRVIAGLAAPLSWQALDVDGEPADPGTVTVGVTRSDGTTLVAAGTATSGSTTSPRTFSLTAAQTALLDRLTVTWTAAGATVQTTTVDVAAKPYFSNDQLRTLEPSLKDPARYPKGLISLARSQVESLFEWVTNRGFVPRYEFERIRRPGGYCSRTSCDLKLRHPDLRVVRSAAQYSPADATTPTSTLSAGDCAAIPADLSGFAYRSAGWSAARVDIGYEYGLQAPPPDVARQAMALCSAVLIESKSGIPDNAVTYSSTEGGWSAVLITPGVRGAHTALPKVNEVLDRLEFVEIAVA